MENADVVMKDLNSKSFENNPNLVFPLDQLPSDVINIICSELSRSSMSSLSMVNKALNTKVNQSSFFKEKKQLVNYASEINEYRELNHDYELRELDIHCLDLFIYVCRLHRHNNSGDAYKELIDRLQYLEDLFFFMKCYKKNDINGLNYGYSENNMSKIKKAEIYFDRCLLKIKYLGSDDSVNILENIDAQTRTTLLEIQLQTAKLCEDKFFHDNYRKLPAMHQRFSLLKKHCSEKNITRAWNKNFTANNLDNNFNNPNIIENSNDLVLDGSCPIIYKCIFLAISLLLAIGCPLLWTRDHGFYNGSFILFSIYALSFPVGVINYIFLLLFVAIEIIDIRDKYKIKQRMGDIQDELDLLEQGFGEHNENQQNHNHDDESMQIIDSRDSEESPLAMAIDRINYYESKYFQSLDDISNTLEY